MPQAGRFSIDAGRQGRQKTQSVDEEVDFTVKLCNRYVFLVGDNLETVVPKMPRSVELRSGVLEDLLQLVSDTIIYPDLHM